MRFGPLGNAAAALLIWSFGVLAARPSPADEPIVTVLADFENDSVAVRLGATQNISPADCALRWRSVPARGQNALALELGATSPNVSVVCNLVFRLSTPLASAEKAAIHIWPQDSSGAVHFRVQDSRGDFFETAGVPFSAQQKWVRLTSPLSNDKLVRVGGTPAAQAAPLWPLEFVGLRVESSGSGKRTLLLDDLEVEHRVPSAHVIAGDFLLDQPTHLYEPGVPVQAALRIENLSRTRKLDFVINLNWVRGDGTEFAATQNSLTLQSSGPDYRARQNVDFGQRFDEPGLYRLVAKVRERNASQSAEFETTIAVMPSNRAVSRGRSLFFGVRADLLREPWYDQTLELQLARELGVQLLALDLPWGTVEPQAGTFEFAALDRALDVLVKSDIGVLLALSEPPAWINGAPTLEQQQKVLESLVRHCGTRVQLYEPVDAGIPKAGAERDKAIQTLQEALTAIQKNVRIVSPPIDVEEKTAGPENTGGALTAWTAPGRPEESTASLQRFAENTKQKWSESTIWEHTAEPLAGPGSAADAIGLARFYLRAAAVGVGSVIWDELRDDSDDPRRHDLQHGLLRRDFSPRTTARSFATLVHLLSGLPYAGPIPGAPAEFESAIFLSGGRQVGVLIPRNGQTPPALLAPRATADGEVYILDYRLLPMGATPTDPPLIVAPTAPFFVSLQTDRAYDQPQIRFEKPWINVPSIVPCGPGETKVALEVTPPRSFGDAYVQVLLPDTSPIRSDVKTRTLKGTAGETIRQELVLTRSGDRDFAPTSMTFDDAARRDGWGCDRRRDFVATDGKTGARRSR